jgi:hypothetical protein
MKEPTMKPAIATLCTLVMLAPAGAALSAPAHGGHLGGAMGGPMSSPTMSSPMPGMSTTTTTSTMRGPTSTGQPNQSCQAQPNTPGAAANAPGSAFNPSGQAGSVYAGQQPQNSRNTASVAQYDVACANQPGGTR